MENRMIVLERDMEGNYLVELTIDDMTFEKRIDKQELRADIRGKQFEIEFQEEVRFYDFDIDTNEGEDVYYCNLYQWSYDGTDVNYIDLGTKEYKRLSSAKSCIGRWFSEYQEDCLCYYHEAMNRVKNL